MNQSSATTRTKIQCTSLESARVNRLDTPGRVSSSTPMGPGAVVVEEFVIEKACIDATQAP